MTRMGLSASLVVAVAMSGCGDDPRTEVLVVSDTDFAAPGEVDEIRFVIVAPDGDTRSAVADLSSGGPLPAVLGLVHEGGSLGPFEVSAEARLGSAALVRRTARFSLQQGRTLMLSLPLLRSCQGAMCATDQTCAPGGCRSVDVAPAELVEWTGPPSRFDASVPPDAGPLPDGAMGDSGCTSQEQCNDLVACTVDTCDMGRCTNRPDNSLCMAGDTCNPATGCGGRPCDDNPDCDDGSFCNGTETCVSSACIAGLEPSCSDGVACTTDRCDDTSDACVNQPDDAACDDGVACTTNRCDPTTGCAYAPNDAACTDGLTCTTDTCDVTAGCAHAAADTLCPAGEVCNLATDCTLGPTWTSIYAIISARCGPCHTTDAMLGGNLDMSSQPTAYVNLVGVTATCGGGVNTRVIPRDATNSLLWRKVADTSLCGSRMPPRGMRLSAAEIAQVRDWITAGAADN